MIEQCFRMTQVRGNLDQFQKRTGILKQTNYCTWEKIQSDLYFAFAYKYQHAERISLKTGKTTAGMKIVTAEKSCLDHRNCQLVLFSLHMTQVLVGAGNKRNDKNNERPQEKKHHFIWSSGKRANLCEWCKTFNIFLTPSVANGLNSEECVWAGAERSVTFQILMLARPHTSGVIFCRMTASRT